MKIKVLNLYAGIGGNRLLWPENIEVTAVENDAEIAKAYSDRFKNDWDKNEDLLWHLRRKVDTKIEPHGFSIKDFQDISDPMVYEIKKTGIKVA